MRKLFAAAIAFSLAGATAAAAAPAPQGGSRIAVSADTFAAPAVHRGQVLDVGYSADARRMIECLATYPGAYDPKTDLIRVAPGVTRRCAL
jgi:hypothetical protein